ncbi:MULTISPECIES: cysteine hydrolase family protein [Pseudomonadaceae]|uniref:Isochorismatase n=1 Tax=Metapseudomonas otitidis TaxID=319939 RepID=A0A6S5RU05_9GAMM|nr:MULTISPECIES: cysteine hydrolase family protein [Pseudomonas]MDL5600880.1 cysteine hydrolase family protein [Bacillus subtilis]KIV71735.1 Isochorismatase [Pseudomonas sp. FeS53a]MCO7553832.1 cysteine hydrolase [Pseudomonas otitidis]MDG9780836.1 cysteine hydrolase [Pseudomonas otitidis]WMR31248.1 cysteine hydrolase family protein [Pseudomonas otitidis]
MSKALLVVDVQAGLFFADPEPWRAAELIATINRLADRARTAGAPVLYVQHDGEAGSELEPGCIGWQLHPGLERAPLDPVVRKTACDAFFETPLKATLQALGVTELVVVGYATEFCVDTSIRRATSEGFSVTLVSDGHTTKDRPHQRAEVIVEHHNWVWAQFIQPRHPLRLAPADSIRFEPEEAPHA